MERLKKRRRIDWFNLRMRPANAFASANKGSFPELPW